MDYDNRLFNEISINSLLRIIYQLIFLFYSFLKPTSEALRLWLCMYVEDQGCQAMNEMLRNKILLNRYTQDDRKILQIISKCSTVDLDGFRKELARYCQRRLSLTAILPARDIFFSLSEFDACLPHRYL